jgi:hypothetical protein
MAELKTKPTKVSVSTFLATLADDSRRKDCRVLVKLMGRITGNRPKMWGASMVGFGSYRYTYASGHSGEYFLTGFSPRKADLTIYVMSGFDEHAALLKKLGRHRTSRACLYIRRLSDVDEVVLADIIRNSVAYMRRKYSGEPRSKR